MYDRNHYFDLGLILKPKPKLADTFSWYHNWHRNHISKGESNYRDSIGYCFPKTKLNAKYYTFLDYFWIFVFKFKLTMTYIPLKSGKAWENLIFLKKSFGYRKKKSSLIPKLDLGFCSWYWTKSSVNQGVGVDLRSGRSTFLIDAVHKNKTIVTYNSPGSFMFLLKRTFRLSYIAEHKNRFAFLRLINRLWDFQRDF